MGSSFQGGEEFRQPPLDVLRYYRRGVRISRIPLLGQAQSVVMLARQPVDIDGSRSAYERLLIRLAMAANGRFPPWRGLTIGLTAVVLTPEPISPGDDEMLRGGARAQAQTNAGRAAGTLSNQPRPGGHGAGHASRPDRPVHRGRLAGRNPLRAIPPFRPADRGVIQPDGLDSLLFLLRRGRPWIIPVERDLERLPPGVDAGGAVGVAAQPAAEGGSMA